VRFEASLPKIEKSWPVMGIMQRKPQLDSVIHRRPQSADRSTAWYAVVFSAMAKVGRTVQRRVPLPGGTSAGQVIALCRKPGSRTSKLSAVRVST